MNTTGPDRRQADVEDLMLVIADLVDRYETSEKYTWRPTRQTRGYDQEVPGPGGQPVWKKPLPKPQQRVHRTREPGLLEQLRRGPGRRRAVAKPPGWGYGPGLGYRQYADASPLVADMAPTPGRADPGGGGRTKPTSAPPAGLGPVETLIDITAAIAHTRARLRRSCGMDPGRVESAPMMLHELLDLVTRRGGDGRWLVPDRQVRRLVGEARSWASTARLALRYDAPVVVLKDRHCGTPEFPGCGGQLKVRADASSDVWCAGIPGRVLEGPAAEGEPWPILDRGCGARWTRVTWIDLLDQGQEAG